MKRVTGSVSVLAIVIGAVVLMVVQTSSGDAQSELLPVAPAANAVPVETTESRTQPAELPERIPPVTDSENVARAALQQPITITFKEVALMAAIETLAKETGTSIRLASHLESNDDVDFAQPVSGDFKDVPLKVVAEKLFGSIPGLTYEGRSLLALYAVDDSEIEINISRELAVNQGLGRHLKKTFIYPISDICSEREDADELMDVLRNSCGQYWLEESPEGLQGVRMLGRIMTYNDDDDIYPILQNADSMRYLKSVEGLVVSASLDTHDDVLKMLRMVREAHRATH